MNGNYYPYQRPDFKDSIKHFFHNKNMLSWLLIVNICVWLAISIASLIAWLFSHDHAVRSVVMDFLSVPAFFPTLLRRFWTIFTYMFFHLEFMHILFNMLWLFWFGKIFTEFLNDKKLLTVYLLGGIFGALLYIFSYNIFPVFENELMISHALGASASVMAIVAAISFYVPNYSLNLLFLGRIKIIWFALAYLIVDLLSIPNGNAGGHIAHLGGALFGVLYAYNLRKGLIKTTAIERFFQNIFMSKQKTKKPSRPLSDSEYNIKKKKEQEEIDRILDKIAKHGYDSLSKKEKEVLFKQNN